MVSDPQLTNDVLAQAGGLGENLMPAMLLAIVVMLFMSSRAQKKERQAFSEWLSKLKKNDRIITKAGIYGTITSVRDDAIVIKIDDDKGTKMTITKESVSHAVPDKNEEKK